MDLTADLMQILDSAEMEHLFGTAWHIWNHK